MKKLILAVMTLLAVSSFAAYNVGDTVAPADNIYWTITGPSGNPEVGNSSTLFEMVGSNLKPVMIFWGQES